MSAGSVSSYLTDATIWVDYFSRPKAGDERERVVDWVEWAIAAPNVRLQLNPICLLEVIYHFYYRRKCSADQIRDLYRTMKSLANVKIEGFDLYGVSEIVRQIGLLSQAFICHVGELSLFPLFQIGTVFVSSDDHALKAYRPIVRRMNPRKSNKLLG